MWISFFTHQAFCQNLKMAVQNVLAYRSCSNKQSINIWKINQLSLESGCPKDAWTPIWLKAWHTKQGKNVSSCCCQFSDLYMIVYTCKLLKRRDKDKIKCLKLLPSQHKIMPQPAIHIHKDTMKWCLMKMLTLCPRWIRYNFSIHVNMQTNFQSY